MKSQNSFWKSSVGRKFVMAATGLLLIGFILGHLLGNLQVFLGPDAFNGYAALLKSMPTLVWTARVGLIIIAIIHIVTAFQLSRINNAARPKPYVVRDTIKATLSSRVMVFSGTFLLMFIIGHLMHFTLGLLYPEYFHLRDAQGRHDVYSMLILSFQQPIAAGLYIAAMLMLWSHLSHGISSVFQSIGVRGENSRAFLDRVGPILSTIIIIGYISIPAAVVTGVIGLQANIPAIDSNYES